MPETTHQLVAIMFTDIVGYTALMGEDEQKAINLLEKNRKLQKPLIERYGGKWIKELGDGVLATFSTVSNAVYCAAAIQQGSKIEPDLNLRIGIHLGDVMFQDGDVFGDGVNIASRLESLAPTGGIWVSEAVSRNIQNKHGIQTLFVREEQLKNVKDPVKIYEIKAEDVELPELKENSIVTPTKSKSPNKPIYLTLAVIVIALLSYWGYRQSYSLPAEVEDVTIAVLAFDDQSPNGDQEWLGDGMADEILNVLAKVEGLQVTGKTSSFSFKGKDATINEIGKALNVTIVLEGSVSKVGDKLRITAQLIDVETDKHIWSNKYDRDASDIFAIIDEVSQSIAGSLKSKLSIEELEEIKVRYAVDTEAYEYTLRGYNLHIYRYLATRKNQDFEVAEKFFIQAISIDSMYVEAYTGLADLYDTKSNRSPEFLIKADSVNNIAFSIDPNAARVLFNKAQFALRHQMIDSGFYYYERAYLLKPKNKLNMLAQIAFSYFMIGLHDKAINLSTKVLKSDPINSFARVTLASSLTMIGNQEEAKLNLEKVLKFDVMHNSANASLFRITLLYDKDVSEAKKVYQTLKQLRPNASKRQLALLLAYEGKKEEALNTFSYPNIALYSLLNMKKEALDIVKSTSTNTDYSFGWTYNNLLNAGSFDFIRNSPEFQKILVEAKKVHEERVAKYGHLFEEE